MPLIFANANKLIVFGFVIVVSILYLTLFIRGKTKTLPRKPTSVSDLPEWNYDGSSTGQSTGENSDVLLRPVAFYRLLLRLKVDLVIYLSNPNKNMNTLSAVIVIIKFTECYIGCPLVLRC